MTLFSFHSFFPNHSALKKGSHLEAAEEGSSPKKQNLAQVSPGHKARIVSFSPKISAERQMHLQAYGLLPGYWVQVISHSPVTVLQIQHLELAMETELAGEIQVDEE